MRSLVAILLSIFLAVHGAGCSSFMVRVPDNYQPSEDIECSGYTRPILDGILSLGSALFVVVLINKTGGISGAGVMLNLYTVPATGAGAIFAASSIVGFVRSNECSKALKAREAWLRMTPEQQEEFEEQWRKGNNK